MNFDLHAHEALQADLRAFVDEKIRPYANEIDKNDDYPEEQLKAMIEKNLTGFSIPKEYGGEGKTVTEQSIIIEEIAKGCPSSAAVLSMYALGCTPLMLAGTKEQKSRYLPDIAKGNRVASFGLTEPQAGSDAAGIETTAKEDGDDYVLDGHKTFIGNGGKSDIYFIFAKTDPEAGTRGISCFLVEKGTEGFSIGANMLKMGLNGQRTTELFLDNCRIPKENLVGELNKGFKIAMQTLDLARIAVAASALGMAQDAYDESLKFANERKQFNQPIGQFQGITFKIADMATKLYGARLITYRASELADNPGKVSREQYSTECAVAKYYATEVLNEIVDETVQIHGARGYMRDSKPERLYRDARVLKIYEGTSEIQKIVIGKTALSGHFNTHI